MIKKRKFQPNPRYQYRINERISAPQLRVLDVDNKQIAILSRYDALALAREQELDLVEISGSAQPPVAKIVDFNKFLYQQSKKKQEEKKKAKVSETKELRLGPFMAQSDMMVSVRRAREFLEDGDKIRLVLKFRGRQITHPEFGHDIIRKVIEALADISKVERDAHLEGKQLVALLSPERKKQNAEEKDQKISVKTL